MACEAKREIARDLYRRNNIGPDPLWEICSILESGPRTPISLGAYFDTTEEAGKRMIHRTVETLKVIGVHYTLAAHDPKNSIRRTLSINDPDWRIKLLSFETEGQVLDREGLEKYAASSL